jgi:hypothetical protein
VSYYADDLLTLYLGDCVEVMRELPAESVDAVVTDPPSSIHFMSKAWDHDKGGREQWVGWMTGVMGECYRILKPGHWIVVWAMPRRQHWTALAIEDAGFRITDVILHCFASGFPKGKGQLKPAYEPWILAKKPGPLVPLGIDAARIGTDAGWAYPNGPGGSEPHHMERGEPKGDGRQPMAASAGRWPPNLLLTDPLFDGGVPGVVGGGDNSNAGFGLGSTTSREAGLKPYSDVSDELELRDASSAGTYSRFFLVPKSSRSDREPLLRGTLAERERKTRSGGEFGQLDERAGANRNGATRANHHPTVKPLDLMRHLVRLVTPPGGTVLDCFAGSGSTLIAANAEGFRAIGIEREQEYLDIAVARLAHQEIGLGLDVAAPVRKASKSRGHVPERQNYPDSEGSFGFKGYDSDEVDAKVEQLARDGVEGF